MKNEHWMLPALFLLGACAGEKSGNEKEQTQPNIIFILADDLGYGDLGSYGQTRIQTPNLDKMNQDGMRFTQHYSGSTVCAPSRCVLMTGLHTGHAKIRGNADVPLDETDITVATLLKNAGYKTGVIGKWGLGDSGSSGVPGKQGFDHFFGYLNQIRAHNFYPDYLWRNTTKVPLDNEVIIAEEGYAKGIGQASTNKNEYSHDLFTAEALEFVETSSENPFFLYLAYTIPHANNEHWLINEHGMEVPDYGIYENEDWPEEQKGLAAMITRMDSDIGKLRQKLEDLGIDENTLIIFTSDNGPHAEGGNDPDFFDSNGILRGTKRDLYEGGVRVPLIAYWPENIKAGQKSDHISAFWDFLPTACHIAGIDTPENIDGISYLPELLGQEQTPHDNLYWEFTEQGGKQAMRKDDWKLVKLDIFNPEKTRVELYNLADDPSEQNDIAEQHPDVIEEMIHLMDEERTESDLFPLYASE